MKEKSFQSLILWHAKKRGWKCYHTHDSRRSEPGFPDLVLVRQKILYRELKTDKGRLTESQKAWGDALIEAGADYAIWRPNQIQDILETLF